MNSSNPIVANNVRAWRQSHGKPDLEAIAAHEAQLARETADIESRFDKVRRCGGKVPTNAADVRFRRGANNEGGRLRWEFVLA